MSLLRDFAASLPWRLICSIFAVQGFYWLFLAPFLFSAPTIKSIEPVSAEYAVLETPDFESASRTQHEPVKLPLIECCEPGYYSVRLDIELDDVSPDGLGFIKLMSVDNFALAMNDTLIYAPGEMRIPEHTYHGQLTRLVHIPAPVLRVGPNTLQIITARSGIPYTDVYAPLVAPFEEIQAQSAQRIWILNEYKQIVTAAFLIVFAFGILLLTHSKRKLFALWLCVLSFAWAASSSYTLITDWPLSGTGRLIVFHAIHFLLPAALFCLVDSWTDKPIYLAQWCVGVICSAAFILASAAMLFGEMPLGYDLGGSLTNWVSLLIGLLTIVRVVIHAFDRDSAKGLEFAVISLAAVALGFDAWIELTAQYAAGHLRAAAPILLVGLSLAFISRNFHLFRSAQDMNDALSLELEERQKELDRAYDNRRALLKQKAHQEERQRIIRDMHDGLGSELMALLVATKRGKANPEWVSESIQSVIDEMRLMMDSMDSVGESLGAALATFRSRITPKIERAGLRLEWDNRVTAYPELEGRDVLNVFRILQEAVTNALKHAPAETIIIRIREDSGNPLRLIFSVIDDGRGIPDRFEPGRGLVNMKNRADALHGVLDIKSTESGTCLSLIVPANMQGEQDG